MLRLLDVPAALRARGWPPEADFELPMQVTGNRPRTYVLHVRGGTAQVEPVLTAPVTAGPAVRFTPGQLAAWYAGTYTSTAAARLAGRVGVVGAGCGVRAGCARTGGRPGATPCISTH